MIRFLPKSLALIVLLAPVPTPAFQPTGDISELYDFADLAQFRTGVRCKMFSSYDRTGGNNDGFSGTYSKLRVENGNSVLAEMAGPGCIYRIWFTHSEHKTDGLLALKKEHIRIFLDGKAEPALDVPLEDIFSGKLERFPSPITGSKSGGFYCYIPIPYRNGCKVVVDGTAVRFYQITYCEFPSAEGVKTFEAALSPEEKESLAKAVRSWTDLGNLEAAATFPIKQTAVQQIKLTGKDPKVVPLVPGPGMIRAITLEVNEKDWPSWTGATLRVHWKINAAGPGIEMPVEYFFGQAMKPAPYRSLLAGVTGQGLLRFYNFFPMPYEADARITIVPPAGNTGLFGKLSAIITPIEKWAPEFAYAHGAFHKALPTQPKVYYPWLVESGRGHYAGTYIVTEGKGKLPLWLEGDERFTVDGELRIHGTGSEDYFNCGWYAVEGRLNGPTAMPLHGFPIYKDQAETARASAYRWHLTDPVPFEKSIQAEIEHGGENEQVADYRSATFWYDDRPEIQTGK